MSFLRHIEKKKQHQIQKEIDIILSKKDIKYHAKNKQSWDTSVSLYQASVSNHGQLFHDLYIEPLIRKIGNVSSDKLIGNLHRLIWVPLIYPETINYGLKKGVDERLIYKFHYPLKQSLSKVIQEKLVAPISSHICYDSIYDIKKHKSQYEIQLKNQTIELVDDIIWTESLEFFQSNQDLVKDKTSIGFCFILLQAEDLIRDFSVIHIIDETIPFYRLSNYSHFKGEKNKTIQLTFEYNLDYFNKEFPNKLIQDFIIKTLRKNENLLKNEHLIFEHQVKEFKNSLVLATKNSQTVTTRHRY